MNRFARHVLANVLIVVVSLLTVTSLVTAGYYSYFPLYAATHPTQLAMSAVKMDAPAWTGSGVYLGNGYIITAGHVADGLSSIGILLSDGTKTQGEVLWRNTLSDEGYDVALVYSPGLGAKSSTLNCDPTVTGQNIHIVGNPGPLEFLTSWGRISGSVKTGQWDRWKSLVALDITAAPGVSGGPVFNDAEQVVGILVSGLILPGRGAFAYSMMVPSETICLLLARAPSK